MNSSTTTTTILFTPSSSSSSSLYSSLSSAYSHSKQQPSSPPSTKTLFHNPISIPQQYQLYEHNAGFNTTPSTPPTNTISSSSKPNRHSLPKSSNIWQQHQQQMQQQQQLHNYQQQQQLGIQSQKPHSAPSSPLFPLTSSGRGAGGLLPRLSLDTSQERLQQKPATIIQHGDQNYLKLFSPTLVESPVSYLDEKQQIADKKMWENGPDEAFQRQLDLERREAYKARSRQQLRGFLLGLWLGFLMGLLVLQQTSAKVFIPAHLARHDTSPLMLFTVLMSFIAVYRSRTRCIMTAIATCVAVLTCFATLVVNQTRYSPEFIVYRSVGGNAALSSSSSSS